MDKPSAASKQFKKIYILFYIFISENNDAWLLFFYVLYNNCFYILLFTIPHHRSPLSSLTSFSTDGTPSHPIGHHSHFPPNPYLRKQSISPGVTSILNMCLCSHTSKTYWFVGSIYVLRLAVKHYTRLYLVLNPLFNSSICCNLHVLSTRLQKFLLSYAL